MAIATATIGDGLTLEIEYTETVLDPEAEGRSPSIEIDVASVKVNGMDVEDEWADYLAHYYFTFLH